MFEGVAFNVQDLACCVFVRVDRDGGESGGEGEEGKEDGEQLGREVNGRGERRKLGKREGASGILQLRIACLAAEWY